MEDERMDEEYDLLERSRAGDTQAFDQLVTLHRRRIFVLIYQIVRNDEDAMDLTQDTFIKAWRSLKRFDGRHPLATWLHRIATNAAIDHFRRKQKRPQCEINDAPMQIDTASHTTPSEPELPGTGLDRANLRTRLDDALDSLSPEHRAVITLKEIDNFSYEQIAQHTGCSIGTVMSRLFYARRNLQSKLKDLYESI